MPDSSSFSLGKSSPADVFRTIVVLQSGLESSRVKPYNNVQLPACEGSSSVPSGSTIQLQLERCQCYTPVELRDKLWKILKSRFVATIGLI